MRVIGVISDWVDCGGVFGCCCVAAVEATVLECDVGAMVVVFDGTGVRVSKNVVDNVSLMRLTNGCANDDSGFNDSVDGGGGNGCSFDSNDGACVSLLALLIGVCLIGGLVRRNGVVEVCCVGGGVRRALHFFDLLVLSDWGVCDGCVCFGL